MESNGFAGGDHLVADLLLLLERVALGRVTAEVGFEVGHVLGLLKFSPSFIVHHRDGSFPSSDLPDTMACPEGHHAGHLARRGHHGPGFTVRDSTCRLFGQVTGRKRKTPYF